MKDYFTQIENSLIERRDELSARITERRGILDTMERDFEKLESMVSLLQADPKTKATKSKRSKKVTTKREGKPVEKTAIVSAAVALLQEKAPQPIPLQDLRLAITERLKSQRFDGFSGAYRQLTVYLQDEPKIAELNKGVYGLANSEAPKAQ